jgi:cell division protein FtsL
VPSAYAYHRAVDNAYLVRERDRRRRREHLRVLLWALPLAAVLLAYTWLHVEVLDTAYDIGQLERELAQAERQRGELALEVAKRTSLPRVEARAAGELGMRAPSGDQTLFWPEVAP